MKKDIWHSGRNSMLLTVRLSLSEYGMILEKSGEQGFTPYEWVKQQVSLGLQRVHSPGSTLPRKLPYYNPSIHKAGDRVMIQQGRTWVPAIVPELDTEGRPIPVL